MVVTVAVVSLLCHYGVVLADVPVEALVGAWLFDAGAGETARDASGNGHDGKLLGPKRVKGKYGGALEFDGKDDIVEIPHHDAFNLVTYTIVAWVNTGSIRTGLAQSVVGKDDPTGKPRNFGLYVDGGERPDVLGTNYTHGNGGTWQSSYGTTSVMDEQWHHLAATHDGAFLRAYTDGVMEEEAAAPIPPDHNTDPVRIGRWGNPRGDFMKGIMDEIAIFNRALTDGEIESVITGLARVLAVEPSGKLATTWSYLKAR